MFIFSVFAAIFRVRFRKASLPAFIGGHDSVVVGFPHVVNMAGNCRFHFV